MRDAEGTMFSYCKRLRINLRTPEGLETYHVVNNSESIMFWSGVLATSSLALYQ